jgi:cytochrome bd ubiquinol oxidase subunit I
MRVRNLNEVIQMSDPLLDTLLLSRIQFAANVSFHILFPTISIALCWFLFYFKLRYKGEGDDVWMRAYRFWVKIFALTFALGVVSGITMSFQFGTNWPGYMETVGNIAGPLLGYEVLTAFFLEATFLGIMLFGINRVSNRLHTIATFLVAFGTTMSAFWIIALNSWMQTPSGFEMRLVDGSYKAFPLDWFDIIFNPSMPYRLAHMLVASGLTAAFLIAGISAYRILKKDHKPAPRLALKTAVVAAAILIPVQIFLGDLHGLNSFKHQPAKVAAVEAVWRTEKGAPLVLFAIPNEKNQENDFAIEIPNMASFILTHQLDGEIKGLNEFPNAHPPVKPVFYGFRIMLGMGVLMLIVSWTGLWQYFLISRGRKKELSPWMLKIFVAMTFSGWIATLAGNPGWSQVCSKPLTQSPKFRAPMLESRSPFIYHSMLYC